MHREREEIYEKWLAQDEFLTLEQEIASTLSLRAYYKTRINTINKEPHPKDIEWFESAKDKVIQLVKEYAELAIRKENPTKLATLADVLVTKKASPVRDSKPNLVVGKLLIDYIDNNNKLPKNKKDLIDSASDELKQEFPKKKNSISKFFSRGLEYYGLEKKIQDKRGRKTN